MDAVTGMQLVMCGFGNIVYGESSKEEKKDRRLYIICSGLILILYALSQVADTAEVYLLVMNSSTAMDALLRVKPQIAQEWWREWVTGICLSLCNWIGDGLLVRWFHFYDKTHLNRYSLCRFGDATSYGSSTRSSRIFTLQPTSLRSVGASDPHLEPGVLNLFKRSASFPVSTCIFQRNRPRRN
jgi:hypothetical protein